MNTRNTTGRAPALSPLALAEIQFQFNLVRTQPIEGVYLEPDTLNHSTWHGVVFVREGIFQGGIFRFDIVFPPSFPKLAPQVFFPPTLLHPLLDPTTGRLSLALRFSSGWDARTCTVLELLLYLKSIFQPALLDQVTERISTNIEVFRMYRDDRPLFVKLANQAVALSTSESALYERGQAASYPGYGSGTADGGGGSSAGIYFHPVEEATIRKEIFGNE
ncbi:hypothetical protein OC846_004154 [Tilletia horrida]|uniref:UBC core domain-containing protein n=1 Tax=Tilletia horrida TaxID=155126 RepID=A0AAN6GP77_9BASI|nr:hypothetical protein OC846_004154 [Tilletia horrida]